MNKVIKSNMITAEMEMLSLRLNDEAKTANLMIEQLTKQYENIEKKLFRVKSFPNYVKAKQKSIDTLKQEIAKKKAEINRIKLDLLTKHGLKKDEAREEANKLRIALFELENLELRLSREKQNILDSSNEIEKTEKEVEKVLIPNYKLHLKKFFLAYNAYCHHAEKLNLITEDKLEFPPRNEMLHYQDNYSGLPKINSYYYLWNVTLAKKEREDDSCSVF